jgi:hypothetical protein
VTAFFEDGSKSTGHVLVGADGTGSGVRKQRLPQARLEETGILSIAGKLPLTAESRALISDKMNAGVSLIMAAKGFGAIIHVMEFKWDRHGVKEGIGGNDAALISDWPKRVYKLRRRYQSWPQRLSRIARRR